MPTINIQGNIITQTAAEWALDATVYSNKTILVTSDLFYSDTDQPRFKFANGVDVWIDLDYVPDGATGGANKIAVSYYANNNFNFADGTSYYLGQQSAFGSNENQANMLPLPAGTVTDVFVNKYVGSTFPSAGNVTLTLVTDALGGAPESNVITSTLNYQTALPRNAFDSYTGLSIPISAGSSYFKIDTPIWATNPVSANMRITLIIEL